MTTFSPTIELRDISSFHVGGQVKALRGRPVEQRRFAQNGPLRAVDPNGDHITGQMYVQRYLQARPRYSLPVLFWHGGGMTGANWEATPDGRPGWVSIFLRAGFDVYVSDAVERGRAGWSRWPEIYTEPPLFRTLQEGWDMFRIGKPEGYPRQPKRTAHINQKFPVEAFDDFGAQWVPRWAGHEELTMAAYQALLEKIGSCIVVGHSQGGGFALDAARRWPLLIKAVAAIEPSGAPRVQELSATSTPHFLMWGDHIEEHPVWSKYRQAVDGYVDALRAQGSPVVVCDLPRQGISGNSHFPMLDRNSGDLAKQVIDWIEAIKLI